MTTREEEIEWDHIYQTRLGILGVTGDPTPEQHDMARREANAAIRALRELERKERV